MIHERPLVPMRDEELKRVALELLLITGRHAAHRLVALTDPGVSHLVSRKRSLWGMYGLKMDPLYDLLLEDPRFQDLLRRMNFPE